MAIEYKGAGAGQKPVQVTPPCWKEEKIRTVSNLPCRKEEENKYSITPPFYKYHCPFSWQWTKVSRNSQNGQKYNQQPKTKKHCKNCETAIKV